MKGLEVNFNLMLDNKNSKSQTRTIVVSLLNVESNECDYFPESRVIKCKQTSLKKKKKERCLIWEENILHKFSIKLLGFFQV